jgi:5-oxoprolinase (ATP-hydrolysing) subunit A
MSAQWTDPCIDLNADVGEGYDDSGISRAVSSLNIACGAHAGDERTMRAALALARDLGLAAGAHPGYADRERFGRVETGWPAEAVAASVRHQIEALATLAREIGLRLAYVKPHGALYHRASRDRKAARAVVETIAAIDPGLAVLGWPGGELLAAARGAGLAAIPEGFVDRRYAPDGTLVSRAEPGALLHGDEALAQAVALATAGVSTMTEHPKTQKDFKDFHGREGTAAGAGARSGADAAAGRGTTTERATGEASRSVQVSRDDPSSVFPFYGSLSALKSLFVKSLCLHSDSPGAVELARAVRRALEAAEVIVAPFADPNRVPAIPVVHVVGAAIVEAGKVLLTRRGERMAMAGKWEFPGGKLETGETSRAALAREVSEELDLEIVVGERVGRGTSLHDGRRIELEVFVARRLGGELRLVEHEEHGWFGAGEIAELDWPEADLPVLPALERLLRAGESLG